MLGPTWWAYLVAHVARWLKCPQSMLLKLVKKPHTLGFDKKYQRS
jgi:hypothetical protein